MVEPLGEFRRRTYCFVVLLFSVFYRFSPFVEDVEDLSHAATIYVMYSAPHALSTTPVFRDMMGGCTVRVYSERLGGCDGCTHLFLPWPLILVPCCLFVVSLLYPVQYPSFLFFRLCFFFRSLPLFFLLFVLSFVECSLETEMRTLLRRSWSFRRDDLNLTSQVDLDLEFLNRIRRHASDLVKVAGLTNLTTLTRVACVLEESRVLPFSEGRGTRALCSVSELRVEMGRSCSDRNRGLSLVP